MATLTVPGMSRAMTPIVDGTYEAEVTGVRNISTPEKEMLVVTWTIMSDGDCLGKEIAQFFTHGDPLQMRMLGQLFAALEIEAVDDQFDTDDILHKTANIVVSTKTGKDGKEYTNVQRVLPS